MRGSPRLRVEGQFCEGGIGVGDQGQQHAKGIRKFGGIDRQTHQPLLDFGNAVTALQSGFRKDRAVQRAQRPVHEQPDVPDDSPLLDAKGRRGGLKEKISEIFTADREGAQWPEREQFSQTPSRLLPFGQSTIGLLTNPVGVLALEDRIDRRVEEGGQILSRKQTSSPWTPATSARMSICSAIIATSS